jgi:hypothetical protein
MPVRDGMTPAPAGTGRIRGRVVSADGGNPLRRAQVRVAAPDIRVMRVARTDADGRYEVSDLPQGRYSISVTRNGYVSLQFGQQRPFEPGRPLDLGDNQLMERIDFALPRGGVITGRITDEVGEPMAGVRMQAMRYQYSPNGQRRLTPVMSGNPFNLMTNDLGEFRVYGLMPGAYILSATADDIGGMMAAAVSPGGAITPGRPSDSEGHGITYYPGTINSDEARPVTVGIGEEASASFALVPAKLTRITGIIRNSQGRPASGIMIALRSQTGNGMFARALPGIGPDGSFTIMDVPPGDHWLEIFPRSAEEESASVAITADGRDINNLVITTSPGATVSGRVTFDGASTETRPGRIMISSPDSGMPQPGMRISPDNGAIDSTGRFQVRGVSGRGLFRAVPLAPGPAPTGWIIRSVMLNGVDITDTPVDLATLGDSSVEIVLTDKQTTLSGIARNSRNEAVKDYVVAVFPDRLKEGALPARFIRTIRPDQEGRYQTRGLPAGDYFAVAVPALEQGAEWDPAFRKQVEPTAKRFRLAEGQTSTIDLQLMQ